MSSSGSYASNNIRAGRSIVSIKRRRNVTAAFGAKRTHALAGRRVLLVDDVLTTGATASACAAALKQAGAEHVSVLTLARTDRRTYTEPRPTVLRAQAAEVGAKS